MTDDPDSIIPQPSPRKIALFEERLRTLYQISMLTVLAREQLLNELSRDPSLNTPEFVEALGSLGSIGQSAGSAMMLIMRVRQSGNLPVYDAICNAVARAATSLDGGAAGAKPTGSKAIRLYRFYNMNHSRHGEPFALCDTCRPKQIIPEACVLVIAANEALQTCMSCGAEAPE